MKYLQRLTKGGFNGKTYHYSEDGTDTLCKMISTGKHKKNRYKLVTEKPTTSKLCSMCENVYRRNNSIDSVICGITVGKYYVETDDDSIPFNPPYV